MCLATYNVLPGTSEEWVPGWKEIRFTRNQRRARSYYRNTPLRRRMCRTKLQVANYPYPLGFHAWVDKPWVSKSSSWRRKVVVRCFLRKLVAVGTQEEQKAIVGLEMLIPSLKMDGTRKKQGRKNRPSKMRKGRR